MVRSKSAKKQNRGKAKYRKQYDRAPETMAWSTKQRKQIPTFVPESRCEYCVTSDQGDDEQDMFDENGYPLPKTVVDLGRITNAATATTEATNCGEMHFRLLDLPAEIRNYIYELALSPLKGEMVCVPDRFLRPSEGLAHAEILRHCTADLICLPCQLHHILGTGCLGLSRASKQLHDETALIPYCVTTFSLHNLYYLGAFLRIIGESGRKALRSLRFGWKLPEEEAHALKMYTNVKETYSMLRQCSLKQLDVNVDVANLLTWRGNGNPRSMMLNYLHELPDIGEIYKIRGLRSVKISWAHVESLEGMEEWAKGLIGVWNSSPGESCEQAVPIPEGHLCIQGSGSQRSVKWSAV